MVKDENSEVYVNAQFFFRSKGSIGDYRMHMVTTQLNKALKKGTNTIAVHTHQTKGAQFIDLAILVDIPKGN